MRSDALLFYSCRRQIAAPTSRGFRPTGFQNKTLGGVREVGPVVELQQPGYQEKPSYPYRNPQAVPQVARVGPIDRPAGLCNRIVWRGLQIQASTPVVYAARRRRQRSIVPHQAGIKVSLSTPQIRYKRTLRRVMGRANVDAIVGASPRTRGGRKCQSPVCWSSALHSLAILLVGCSDEPSPAPSIRTVPSPTSTTETTVAPEPTPTPTPTSAPTNTPTPAPTDTPTHRHLRRSSG